MDNKLSELSKPYGYEYVTAGRGHVVMSRTLPPVDMCEVKPLYSQEYVSALLSELEAKDKRIAELEAKLATPVRLQSPWVDKVGNRWLMEGTTSDVIRAAGFAVTVEGEE